MRYGRKAVCDFCSAETNDEERWPPKSGDYSINQVTLQLKTGHAYLETRHGKTLTIDMCPMCFLEKLVPWIESQGAKIREKDWDY